MKTGLIDQANGSAYVETAKLKLACAVFVLLKGLDKKPFDLIIFIAMVLVKVNPLLTARRAT